MKLTIFGVLLGAAAISFAAAGARKEALLPSSQAGESPHSRIVLVPRLNPGQTLRYQLEFRSHSKGSVLSAVDDPQGARELDLSLGVLMRLDVLRMTPAGLRIRSTYEQLAAKARSDTPDPGTEQIEKSMAQFQGKSFEFTLDKQGRVQDLSGLGELLPGQDQAVQEWFKTIASAESLPERGIALGERWASEQDAYLPLAGAMWVRESTYLRNEPCRSAPNEAASGETCAVILTRSLLTRKGNPKDVTPPEYSQQGLRSSGTAEGTGENLKYISLSTGLVVSMTQTAAQKMNVTVSLADGSNAVKYDAVVKTESQLSLVSESAAKP